MQHKRVTRRPGGNDPFCGVEMGDKAPRDAAGSPIVADQAVGSARPEGVEFDESFDSESGFTTRVPRSPRRSAAVTLKIDASATAEEIRRVRQELQDELQRNALDLDPAAVERLGMLTAAAGELGRVLGHVLQQGFFGADPDERAVGGESCAIVRTVGCTAAAGAGGGFRTASTRARGECSRER